MKRWLQSRQYPDESFAPMLEVIYYDDVDFEIYEATFKLSAEAVQEVNARGSICEVKIDGVDTLFELSDKSHFTRDGRNACKLVENKKYHDVDIDSIEADVQKHLNDIKSLGLAGFKDYDTYYDKILENIKHYRRQKNLDNLGI